MLLVVGGGPAGLFVAGLVRNRDVLVLEEHKSIGFPEHCAGIISLNTLRRFGLTDANIFVENYYYGFRFRDLKHTFLELRKRTPFAVKINRPRFDQELYFRVLDHGHRVVFGTQVKKVLRGESRVITSRGNSISYEQLVIAVGPRNLPGAPMGGRSRCVWQTQGLQTVVETSMKINEDTVDIILDPSISDNMFGWLAPINNRQLLIGVGAKKSLLQRVWMLKKEVDKKYGVRRLVKIYGGTILRGPPLNPLFMGFHNVYGIGDYICTSKPYTGGGLYAISRLGRILAKVIDGYKKLYEASIEVNSVLGELYAQYMITRMVFRSYPSLQLILMGILRLLGLENIVSREIDFDNHAGSLIKILTRKKRV